jgi:anti-sigma B factor antagonist
MTINKTVEGGKLIIAPEGRLDTMTSPQLDAELDNSLRGVSELVFDFAGLDYISSAGLVFSLKLRRL